MTDKEGERSNGRSGRRTAASFVSLLGERKRSEFFSKEDR